MIGVADAGMAERMIGVLAARDCERALVVHGDDGLDELTLSTTSSVVELRDGKISTYSVDPGELGLTPVPSEALKGGDPSVNAELAERVLSGAAGPHRDVILLNAAAGLLTVGIVDELGDGVEVAAAAIDGGHAQAALDRLVEVSNTDAS
jgi:anthranilate phosphoribosyltransferase